MTKDPKLKPCKCGRDAKVEWVAGMGRGVIEYSNNPFASSHPTYYIFCPRCKRNLCIRLTKGSSVEYRDKMRRKLIRQWNGCMDADYLPANATKIYDVKF